MALSQKILKNIYIANMNIPYDYHEQKTVNNLSKFSAEGSNLESFVGNGNKF